MLVKKIRKQLAVYFADIPIPAWGLIVAQFIYSFARIAILFIPIFLLVNHHYAMSKVGLILSANGVGFCIGSYTGGRFSDRFPIKNLATFGLGIRAIICLLLLICDSLGSFMVVAACIGFFDASIKTIMRIGLMSMTNQDDRLRINAINRLGINLASGCAAIVGGLLLDYHYGYVVLFSCFTSVLTLIVIMYITYIDVPQQTIPLSIFPHQWRISRAYVYVLIVYFLSNFVFFQTGSTYLTYIKQHFHFNGLLIGGLFVINAAVIILVEVPLLMSLKHINQLMLAALGALLIACGISLIGLNNYPYLPWISAVVWTLGEILLFSPLFTWLFNYLDERDRGVYVGIYDMMPGIANIAAPLIGGYLYAYSSGKLLWTLCLAIGILCIYLVSLAMRTRQTQQDINLEKL